MARRDVLQLCASAALCLVLGVLGTLTLAGDHLRLPPPPPVASLAVAIGILAAAAVSTVILVSWRRSGSERMVVREALRTGRLPAGVDDAALHAMIRKRADSLAGRRWGWPLLAAFQAALAVSHVLDASSDLYARVFWCVTAGVWVVSGAALAVSAWRDRPRAIALLNELDVRMGRPTGTT